MDTVRNIDGPGNVIGAYFVVGSLTSVLYGLTVTVLSIVNKTHPNIYWWLLLLIGLVPVLSTGCLILVLTANS